MIPGEVESLDKVPEYWLEANICTKPEGFTNWPRRRNLL